jgi:hypothetical protein
MKIMGVKNTKSMSPMESIIPIDKPLQLDILLICKSCKQLLNTNKIKSVILMCKHIYNESKKKCYGIK